MIDRIKRAIRDHLIAVTGLEMIDGPAAAISIGICIQEEE